jgi:fused signal recognition particle receptor
MAPESKARSPGGFFSRLKARLSGGTAWLGEELTGLVRGGRLDETTLESLEDRLLMADVGVEATGWLIERLRKSSGQGDGVARLRAAMLELLQPLEVPLDPIADALPFVVLAVGVNGTGKTTTLGKLAHRLKAEGRSVLLAAGDTFRAAAVEQLAEWGERVGVPVVSQAAGADPAAVMHDALQSARARAIDVVLADTAGRLHTSTGLMDELAKIKRVAQRFDTAAPHEVLLVLDASQGQNGLKQASVFHEHIGVTGLVITKLDGTAKGGVVLAIARRLALPIRYVAVGESLEDFAVFRADEFVDALLGEPRG